MPSVSVILPNYNHSQFLKKRIDSIINQSFQDFELIILDDCSTDSSKEIIEAYRSNLKVTNVVYNQTNSGSTFKQWKKGIELARGKYVWFAESDDYAHPHFLERMVPLFDRENDTGLLFCNSHIINVSGEIIGNTNTWGEAYIPAQGKGKTTFFNGYRFCIDHLFLLCRIPNASAVLFTRALVVNNIHWIDGSLRNSGDWKLWIHFALHANLVWLNEDLNYFRKHVANVTNAVALLKPEALYILKEVVHKKATCNRFRLFESICLWSFNSTAWSQDPKYNARNFGHYFKNNISIASVFYLFVFLLKRSLIFLKTKLIAKSRPADVNL